MPSFRMLISRLSRSLRLVALLAVTGALAACSSPPTNTNFAEMTFRHLKPIELLVSDVKIESNATQSTQPPYIGHQFPTPPETAMRNWARDRLVARGAGLAGATATFTITRAEATGQALGRDTGFTGLFKQELSDRYTVNVEGMLTITDRNGGRGTASAQATHTATVREDVTLADRQKIMYEMTEKVMTDFNAEMERNIRNYLRNWVQ